MRKDENLKKRPLALIYVCVAALLCLFLLRELTYISGTSQTYDEHFYIGYGYSFLKTGDFRLRKDKTNLVPILSALPLLATGARFSERDLDWQKSDTKYLPKGQHWALTPDLNHVWQFGLNFLYRNTISADRMLFLARLPIVLLSLILGFFVFKWSRELYGDVAGLVSLFLYTNCPNILAHSGFVTEDIALSLGMFLTVYLLSKYYKSGAVGYLAGSGVCLGLALNTKYTAIILIPALIFFIGFEYLRTDRKKLTLFIRDAVLLSALALLVLSAFYKFTDLREYFMGFKYAMEYVKRGQNTFLLGEYSMKGFWNYFIHAFFVKTPIPMLLSLGLVLAVKTLNYKSMFQYRDETYLLLLPVVLFVSASLSPLQIGLRHILPVYPFLFVLCGELYPLLKGKLRWVLAGLGVWYLAGSLAVHPHYLSYFNEAAGGPANGYKYLLDSNLDWGQDLKELREYIRKAAPSDVILSYFGAGVPEYFGRDFQDLFSFGLGGEKNHINSPRPKKEFLVISVTNLQGLYLSLTGVDAFFWLKDKRPMEVIGNTIYVYDITGDYAAHERLAHIYFISRQHAQTARECARALVLNPGSAVPEFLLQLDNIVAGSAAGASLNNIGRVMTDKGKYDRVLLALAGMATSSQAARAYAEAFSLAGLASFHANKFGQAEKLLMTARWLDGSLPYPYAILGAIYITKLDYEEALKVLSFAETRFPSEQDILFNKGLALYYLKDFEQARKYFNRCLEINPKMAEASRALATIR